MGLSASQARLLSLTARMSDLELQAQTISNSKIRLADSSSVASENYEAALNKQVIQVDSTGIGSTYTNATLKNLTTYDALYSTDKQRFVEDSYNRIVVSAEVSKAYKNSNKNLDTFLNNLGFASASAATMASASVADISKEISAITGAITAKTNVSGSTTTTTYSSTSTSANMGTQLQSLMQTIDNLANTYSSSDLTTFISKMNSSLSSEIKTLTAGGSSTMSSATLQGVVSELSSISTSDLTKILSSAITGQSKYKYDAGAITYYTNLFNMIKSNDLVEITNDQANDSDWLYQQLNSGNVHLVEQSNDDSDNDGVKDWKEVSYSSGDATLKTVTDSTDVAKAEAEYNREMAEIEAKDKRFDLELQNINTEHTAIQTEVDSVKKVIDKNIDRSFKIFDA